MKAERNRRTLQAILFLAAICVAGLPAQAQYSGGSGTPDDPYRIATALDLIALGETPHDYDKHFILTADIDLDPNLPGRKVFDQAVIGRQFVPASGRSPSSGAAFSGVIDGAGHTIAHLTIVGEDYLGLFGRLASSAEVRNLAVMDVNIIGSGLYFGGLVAFNEGRINACYVKGEVHGYYGVGGAVGATYGIITACYAQATVSGAQLVGGFAGGTGGTIVRCYATGQVVRADGYDFLGGFAGQGNSRGSFTDCLWDTQTSGIDISGCGIGLDTTAMMQSDAYSLNGWAGDPNWVLDAGRDYPRLAWEGSSGQVIGEPVVNEWLAGSGTLEDPYQIATAEQLARIGTASILWDKALALVVDLDVNGIEVRRIGICPGSEFRGSFDGRGHTIRNLAMDTGNLSAWWVGLFGWIHADGRVSNLGLERATVKAGRQRSVSLGTLAGLNYGSISNCTATHVLVETQSTPVGASAGLGGIAGANHGRIEDCLVTGSVGGDYQVAGLVGFNLGSIVRCRADAAVLGRSGIAGGLVGDNAKVSALVPHGFGDFSVLVYRGIINDSCATGEVAGDQRSRDIGGLVGDNDGEIAGCYATGTVSGDWRVGGLVGLNLSDGATTNSYARGDVTGRDGAGGLVALNMGTITACYATSNVVGQEYIGGLVGDNWSGDIAGSFWDIQTSGRTTSEGGMGLTTGEMQTAKTFLDAGWDFVGETDNGTDDIWWIDEGRDYPRLWWEAVEE